METIELKYFNGSPMTISDENLVPFFKEFGDKTLKETFNLDESDNWLKDISFHDLELSIRAHNTIAQSFGEREWSKQTLEYVVNDYTPEKVITRCNVGKIAFKEFMYKLYETIKLQDEKSGKERSLGFDPEIFKA